MIESCIGSALRALINSIIESKVIYYLEQCGFRALTMQDSITESKTINYILFMVFY